MPTWRGTSDAAGGHAALTLARQDERAMPMIVLAPTVAAGDLSLKLTFAGLRPAAFADAAPALAPLVTLGVPLQGNAGLEVGAMAVSEPQRSISPAAAAR